MMGAAQCLFDCSCTHLPERSEHMIIVSCNSLFMAIKRNRRRERAPTPSQDDSAIYQKRGSSEGDRTSRTLPDSNRFSHASRIQARLIHFRFRQLMFRMLLISVLPSVCVPSFFFARFSRILPSALSTLVARVVRGFRRTRLKLKNSNDKKCLIEMIQNS